MEIRQEDWKKVKEAAEERLKESLISSMINSMVVDLANKEMEEHDTKKTDTN